MQALLAATDVAVKRCQKLQTLLQNFGTNLQIELAVMVDVDEQFVKACYNLEGDGLLSPVWYAMLSTVRASVLGS